MTSSFFFLTLLGKCFYFLLLEYENSHKLILSCKKLSEIFKGANLQILENFAPKGCFFHAFNNIKVKTPISFKAIVIKTQRKKKERKVRYYYNSVACIKTLQSPYQK